MAESGHVLHTIGPQITVVTITAGHILT